MPHVPGSSGRRPDAQRVLLAVDLRDDVAGARPEHAQARPGSGGERRHPQVAVGAGAVAQREERVVVARRRRGGCRSRRRRAHRARTAEAPDRRGGCPRSSRTPPPFSGSAGLAPRIRARLRAASARSATRSAGRRPARPRPMQPAQRAAGRSPSAGSGTRSAASRSRARARRARAASAALGASGLSTTTASPASSARSRKWHVGVVRRRDHDEVVLVRAAATARPASPPRARPG